FQDADGDRLPPVGDHLGVDALDAVPAVRRHAEHPCRRAVGSRAPAGRGDAGRACRRAACSAARHRGAAPAGRAVSRLPPPAAAKYRREGGRRGARHACSSCLRGAMSSVVVCGVDEAGRGPLAGPVYAAAVILDPARRINGLADSKLLAPERREVLAGRIKERAVAWAVARASVEEIDRLNIFRASLLAMRRAIETLAGAPEEVWIDGRPSPEISCRARAIVDGDALHPVISAASILAK